MSVGRPTDYKPEYAAQAEKLCKLGATDFELADFFEVSTRTVQRWKLEHEDFCHSAKLGKETADERVENSLYNRAVGYSFESEEVFSYQGEIIRADVVKHVPPDPTAAMHWLKNRKAVDWKDRQNIEHSGKLTLEDLVTASLSAEK